MMHIGMNNYCREHPGPLKVLLFYLRFAYMLSICTFVLTTCSYPTQNKLVNLRGKVILLPDETSQNQHVKDYSGVSVKIYSVKYPTEGMAAVNLYPNIGISISQQCLFDPVFEVALDESETGVDGIFNLRDIEPGHYNIVMSKAGWGTEYIYMYEIMRDTDLGDVGMRPAIIVPSYVSNDYVMQSGREYNLTSNVIFDQQSQLTIEKGSCLVFDPLVSLSIYGEIDFVESDLPKRTMIKTSTTSPFDRIRLVGSNDVVIIKDLILFNSYYGFETISANLRLEQSLFKVRNSMLVVTSSTLVEVNNCVMHSYSSSVSTGIASVNSTVHIDKCIIEGFNTGLDARTSSMVDVSDSYFHKNEVALQFLFDCQATITYNTFVDNSVSIANASRSYSQITRNAIKGTIGIYNYTYQGFTNEPGTTSFLANNNNFDCSEYCIRSTATSYSTEFVYCNAKSNYWYTTDINAIADKIWDRLDLPVGYPNYANYTSIVEYSPFLSQAAQAGIR